MVAIFRNTVFAGLIALGAMTVSPVHAEQITAAADGKTKINLSGRQRMLSQRMAKAACFASIDVQKDTHIAMLGDAHGLFERTLDGLSKGDNEQGMLPESNPDVLSNLSQVANLWSDYKLANDEIVSAGAVSAAQLEIIAAVNVPVLKQMHKTVGVIETVYGASGDVHPALGLALNVSGRQRMLSQKASKEFCFVVAGVDAEANRAALKDTVELFTTSLNGLIDGDPAKALAPAPTPEIRAQLEKVRGMWAPLQAVFQSVIDGATPSAEDIEKVATENNPVLKEMNAAVFMYNKL